MNSEMDGSFYALQEFNPAANAVYPIDAAAHLAHVPRHFVLVCCKYGLVSPRVDPEFGGYFFDQAGIETLQRIGYLHADCGVNMTGIRIILRLIDELERFRAPRGPWIYNESHGW
jgi:hypothetical protein